MTSVTIRLPYLPTSTNKAHEVGHHGQIHLSQEAKDFRAKVVDYVLDNKIPMIPGLVKYHVVIAPGKFKNGELRPGDCSNRLKQLEDALNHLVWEDDELVDKGSFVRDRKSKTPYIKITISSVQSIV